VSTISSPDSLPPTLNTLHMVVGPGVTVGVAAGVGSGAAVGLAAGVGVAASS